MNKAKLNVKHPCNNCKYFATCGDNTRTEHCNGRETVGRTWKLNHTRKEGK